MAEREKVSPEVDLFIKNYTKLAVNADNWYYIPRWFKQIGPNLYESYSMEEIPDELREVILNRRGKDV